jgi:hypothetical protein
MREKTPDPNKMVKKTLNFFQLDDPKKPIKFLKDIE